jgi:hypothetical protein
MKERKTHAGNVTTGQLQRVTSMNTSEGCIKGRSTYGGNVETSPFLKVSKINISKQYIM